MKAVKFVVEHEGNPINVSISENSSCEHCGDLEIGEADFTEDDGGCPWCAGCISANVGDFTEEQDVMIQKKVNAFKLRYHKAQVKALEKRIRGS